MLSFVLRGVFSLKLLEKRSGLIVLSIEGKNVYRLFSKEAGGHRWQRVPPTEKKGRRQTSTITVAVLKYATETDVILKETELEIKTCRGSGAGGQHRNVTDSAVQVVHTPSGIRVRCESERSQHQNKYEALNILRSRLQRLESDKIISDINCNRRTQIGSGMRGDKIRTITEQRNEVIDHIDNKRMKLKDYLRGNIDLLY